MIEFLDRSRLGIDQSANEKTETMLIIKCAGGVNAMTAQQIQAKKEHELSGGMVVLKPNQGVSSFEFLNRDGSKFVPVSAPVEPKPFREWDYNTASWKYN